LRLGLRANARVEPVQGLRPSRPRRLTLAPDSVLRGGLGRHQHLPDRRDELAIDALDPNLGTVAQAVTEVQGASRPGIDPAERKSDSSRPEPLREMLRIGRDIEDDVSRRIDQSWIRMSWAPKRRGLRARSPSGTAGPMAWPMISQSSRRRTRPRLASARVTASSPPPCGATAPRCRSTCATPAVPSATRRASRLGQAQNTALRYCYRNGGKDCVIRAWVCDSKG
jgi:hypothetical protein